MRTLSTMMSLLLVSAVCIAPASANFGATQTQSAIAPLQAVSAEELEGRWVWGTHGESLGYILAVDQDAQLIELQTARGIGVTMPASLLAERFGEMIAPTTSRADVRAMSRTQTGRTVAINIDLRPLAFRS